VFVVVVFVVVLLLNTVCHPQRKETLCKKVETDMNILENGGNYVTKTFLIICL